MKLSNLYHAHTYLVTGRWQEDHILFKMAACPAFGISHDIQNGSLHWVFWVDRMMLIIQNKMAAYAVLFWKTL